MTSILEFLKTSSSFPRFFWKDRESLATYVGYGENKKPSEKEIFTFKAQTFYPGDCNGIWSDFPKQWTFSPQQLISSDWAPASITPDLPHCIQRTDTPSIDQWENLVNNAREKIQKEVFRKVVLPRRTTLTFDAPLKSAEILKGLFAFGNETSLFMVQLDPSTAFIGASPEKLFSRSDRNLWTEALAGTIDSSEKWSPKEFAEVEAVRLFLQQQLLPCCQNLQWETPEERPFGNLKHLYQRLKGCLKTDISDAVLISKLHPTPALGGFPRDPSLQYLRSIEMFDRGWYGAPIGLISESGTNLAVAIRSMVVRGHHLHLFSGAGIVKGSNPLKEWEELDRKIAHVLRW